VRVVHEQRKDHACGLCGAAFGTSSNMGRHIVEVHCKEDHHCPFFPQCPKFFSAARYRDRHIFDMHVRER